jgi:hypothetical protein
MPERRGWAQRVLMLVLVVLAGLVLSPMMAAVLRSGVGLALGAVYVLAYLFAIVALPLMLFALAKFGYSVFLRPYLRVWNINRIRNARQLQEVIRRGQPKE